MPDVDPWLPTRLAREAAVVTGERRIAAAVRAALRVLCDAMVGVYDATTGTLDRARMDTREPLWTAAVDEHVLPVIAAVHDEAWLQQAEEVAAPRVPDTLTASGFRDTLDKADLSPDAATTAHLATVRNRMVGVSDEVFGTITSQLEEGRRFGESIPDLAARVDNVLVGEGAARWKNRATVVARTETIAAYNHGHLTGTRDAAAAFGIGEEAIVRVWLSAADKRTRPTHSEADGQQAPGDIPFTVGGAALDYPGDPGGPAREVVQCRCTMQFLMPGDPGYPALPTLPEVPLSRDRFSDPTTTRTRAVDAEEYQRLYTRGSQKYAYLQRTASPPKGLDDNWKALTDDAYDATRTEWGGMTVNAHTGKKVADNAKQYALTARTPGMQTVSVPVGASRAEVTAAMNEARRRYAELLSYDRFHLGVFRDDAIDRIDFDPVLVVDSLDDVEAIGTYTENVGGAYHFADGNGYWPPHLDPAAAGEYANRRRGLTSSGHLTAACTAHPCTCRGCDEFDCGMDACACCWVYNDQGILVPEEDTTMADEVLADCEGREVGDPEYMVGCPDCEGRAPDDPAYMEGCPDAEVEESMTAAVGDPVVEEEPTGPDCEGREPGDPAYGEGCPDEEPVSAATDPGLMFHGVLAPEDTFTGDARHIRADALGWRDLPIPMKVQIEDLPGHDGSVRAGRMDRIWRDTSGPVTKIRYEGVYATTAEGVMTDTAQATHDEVEAKVLRGVSVDMDDVTVEYLNPENGQPMDPMDESTWPEDMMAEPIMDMVYGRISAATACSIPAFQEAYIANGPYVEGEPEPGDDSWPTPGEGRTPGPEAIAASAWFNLVAAGDYARPVYPPEWFADPGLTEPTPLTVTDDGRVYGHLATWGTCHIGFDGVCVTPPYSATAYAHFLKGTVMTSEGEVPTGAITMGTGHAAVTLGHRPAAAHYDDTGLAAADVAAGEDAVGIWVAGHVRPGTSPTQVEELRRAGALSGDWRRIGGNLELVAALGVNVGGFPIPRVRAAAQAGRQVALVAAGMVTRMSHPAVPVDAHVVARQVLAIIKRRERVETLTRRMGRDKQTRLAAVLAVMGRN